MLPIPVLGFLVAQMVKNPPAMWETWVRLLGWEDLLEENIATHSSILAWRIPTDRGAWWATVHRVTEWDMTERLSTHTDLFKKIGDTKGNFHAKLGTIKNKNGKDLIEAEQIKKM